jgi:hypothetical protein
VQSLCMLFKKVWDMEEFPSQWMRGVICPLFKVGMCRIVEITEVVVEYSWDSSREGAQFSADGLCGVRRDRGGAVWVSTGEGVCGYVLRWLRGGRKSGRRPSVRL